MGDLTRHFGQKDFSCRCGQCDPTDVRIHLGLVGALDAMGAHFGVPSKSSKDMFAINRSWVWPEGNGRIIGRGVPPTFRWKVSPFRSFLSLLKRYRN